MNFSKIPEELKKDGLFCFWKREQVGGRTTKVPYRLDGKKARSTERDDFVCFDIAERYAGRFDGKGYPEGLSGDNISRLAKIIAVADAYDAMTSKRPYRDVLPQAKVREQIEKGCGTQFDSGVAHIMLDIIDADTEYKLRQ